MNHELARIVELAEVNAAKDEARVFSKIEQLRELLDQIGHLVAEADYETAASEAQRFGTAVLELQARAAICAYQQRELAAWKREAAR